MLAILGGAGYLAWCATGESIAAGRACDADGGISTAVRMVDEPSNTAVDPTGVRSDRERFPVVHVEPGPFGVPRFRHTVTGRAETYTHDPNLGMWAV